LRESFLRAPLADEFWGLSTTRVGQSSVPLATLKDLGVCSPPRSLHRAAYHLSQVLLNPPFVNPNHLAQRLLPQRLRRSPSPLLHSQLPFHLDLLDSLPGWLHPRSSRPSPSKCRTLSVIFAERPTGMQLHRDRQCDVKFSFLSIGRTF